MASPRPQQDSGEASLQGRAPHSCRGERDSGAPRAGCFLCFGSGVSSACRAPRRAPVALLYPDRSPLHPPRPGLSPPGARTPTCSQGGPASLALVGCLRARNPRPARGRAAPASPGRPGIRSFSVSFHFPQTSRAVAMGTYLELEKHSKGAPSSRHWGSPCGAGLRTLPGLEQGRARPLERLQLGEQAAPSLWHQQLVATRNPEREQ